MNRLTSLILLAAAPLAAAHAQTSITPQEAAKYYTSRYLSRVSVHDPSVVYDGESKQYYIFGSHQAQARTTNLMDWSAIAPAVPWGKVTASGAVVQVQNTAAFNTPQVKQVVKGGQTVSFPAFDAEAWAAQTNTSYNIDGNMWAPDVVYNPVMKKWCQYLSVNGDKWASSIVLLTADKITGPYVYQGPVVVSGFNGTNTNSYKDTDLELVLGTQATLPSRYAKGGSWGTTWPNNIDPCVFYDEEGKLWMSYGSWSGGIFMLQLDETTGLRDYDVTYPLVGSGANYTSDPYFGKKIAGGYYVSGEASYIQHIGNYYYLFMTYGGLDSKGGYMMEVFRSDKPDGPYKDAKGTSAIFSSYVMNYGRGASYRGTKLLGAYTDWGFMAKGTAAELSQGHNSAITDGEGRSFLVYHTRFNNGTEGHQVRVHQLFSMQDGWLVAAPFEFTGETVTDAQLASSQQYAAADVAGTYEVLLHKQGLDYAGKEVVSPVSLTLNADGTVSGLYSGTWQLVAGTGYVDVTLGGITYSGVVVEQQMEPTTIKALAITAMSSEGVGLWAYKMRDDYRLAYTYNNSLPVKDGDEVTTDLGLGAMAQNGVEATWASSEPAVISPEGRFDATAMSAETMPVDLTLTLRAGDYVLTDVISVVARRSDADYWTGALAHYPFDTTPITNAYNTAQTGTLRRSGTASVPTLATDAPRQGRVLHTNFGASGAESYLDMPNALSGQTLADGFTVSFMVKLNAANNWDALFSLYNATTGARLYITGNTYVGYNNNKGNWIDLNHGNTATNNIAVGQWTLLTLTVSRTEGPKLYLDGKPKAFATVNGKYNGTTVSQLGQFGFAEVVNFARSTANMYIGYGSFWGSADASFDDLRVYDRVLSADDVAALYVTEINGSNLTGIAAVTAPRPAVNASAVYNLQGQQVGMSLDGLPRGIYIRGGRKFVVR